MWGSCRRLPHRLRGLRKRRARRRISPQPQVQPAKPTLARKLLRRLHKIMLRRSLPLRKLPMPTALSAVAELAAPAGATRRHQRLTPPDQAAEGARFNN